MAIVFTGSKTVTTDVSPQLTAAVLTTLMATPPEQMTVENLRQLESAVSRLSGGHVQGTTLGTLFV